MYILATNHSQSISETLMYLAGVNIVNAIFKYRGFDWSALRKLSLTVAFALTIITPDTVVAQYYGRALKFRWNDLLSKGLQGSLQGISPSLFLHVQTIIQFTYKIRQLNECLIYFPSASITA